MKVLVYDCETDGVDTQRARPVQFAGSIYDSSRDEVVRKVIYAKPPVDSEMTIEAFRITGISLEQLQAEGLPEIDFAREVSDFFEQARSGSEPLIIGGYNNISFDDEILRRLFHRNGIDPFGHEWRNGTVRIDVMRLVEFAYAMAPETLKWPLREDGAVSLKLTDLASANGIDPEGAHDAMVDVTITGQLIGVIKRNNPKFLDFAIRELTNKKSITSFLDAAVAECEPVIHVSRYYGKQNHFGSVVVPVVKSGKIGSRYYGVDLRHDPADVFESEVADLHARLYTSFTELESRDKKPPLTSIKANAFPIVLPLSFAGVRDDGLPDVERFGLDPVQALERLQLVREKVEEDPRFPSKVASIHELTPPKPSEDAYNSIYDGFLDDEGRRHLSQLSDRSTKALFSTCPYRHAEMAGVRPTAALGQHTVDLVTRMGYNRLIQECLGPQGLDIERFEENLHRLMMSERWPVGTLYRYGSHLSRHLEGMDGAIRAERNELIASGERSRQEVKSIEQSLIAHYTQMRAALGAIGRVSRSYLERLKVEISSDRRIRQWETAAAAPDSALSRAVRRNPEASRPRPLANAPGA